MKKPRIKSKATLQKMRDEGVIKFSQPERKIANLRSVSFRSQIVYRVGYGRAHGLEAHRQQGDQ